MNKKQKYINFFKSYIKSIIVLLIVSFLILVILYNMKFTYRYISNSLFIPSILTFIVSIGINVGATNIMNPMKYTFMKITNRKKTNAEYEDYADYLDQKEVKANSNWGLTFAILTLLILSLVFAFIN